LKLKVTIEGKTYEVEVEVLDEAEGLQEPEPKPAAPAASPRTLSQNNAWNSEGTISRSPVMGLVVRVNVQPGQAVAAGELLAVLEAMKMETNIVAPRAAKVKAVHIAAGEAVKLNQILIELE
jgi:biotin carboxyl carrier protein